MTQAYWLDRILYKNRIADFIRRAPGLEIMRFVGNAIQDRRKKLEEGDTNEIKKDDFLSRFLAIQSKNTDLPPW